MADDDTKGGAPASSAPHSTAIDNLRPEFLSENYTIGTAIKELEQLVTGALRWQQSSWQTQPLLEDAALEATLNEWAAQCQLALEAIFTSSGPLLQFISSRPDLSIAPRRQDMGMVHRHLSRGLLAIRQRLLDDRERISLASQELTTRLAEHSELRKIVSDTNQMTEDVWFRVIGEPIVKPPVARLRDLGITQDAIYDIIKWAATAGWIAATAHGGH
jgi:hypothetical protein